MGSGLERPQPQRRRERRFLGGAVFIVLPYAGGSWQAKT
jgi:hypothetical protein